MVPLVYLIGLVAMIFTALSYAQMAEAFPIAGSVYAYVGRGLNPSLGFIAGWTILLDYLLVPTLLYVFAAESMVGHLPRRARSGRGSSLFLVINTGVNYVGISFTADRQPDLPGGRAALHRHLRRSWRSSPSATGSGGATSPPSRSSTPRNFSAPLVGTALSIAVLSFLGFDGIATLSEEAKGGQRSAGIAMIAGLFLVAIVLRRPDLARRRCSSRTRPPSRTPRRATPSSTSSPASATTGGRSRSSP